MAMTQMPVDGTVQIPVEPAQPIELRKEAFASLLATKVEQGYDIESQGDTEAVLVTRGRRRLFRSSMAGKRQRISIDEQGRTRGGGL
jgi:hypothetical protein